MMEEVSNMMAYDAQVMEQMSEEEILACLVSETEPKFTVPSKKAKLGESLLQIMEDVEEEKEEEDTLDKYVKENHQLLQTSLRLEQENDDLAYRLISSKVALRNALDKAEDRVDELVKDLLKTRYQLRVTEEEKKGNEEETVMLKEVFRRELEKAEQDVKRSSGITEDYKQICSQLTNRLDKQQAAHREELESLKSAIKTCSRCQHIVDKLEEAPTTAQTTEAAESLQRSELSRDEDRDVSKTADPRRDEEKELLKTQVRELEQELAQTKLQMVEAKCKIQELEHQRTILSNDLQEAKNNWISKAFTSLRTSSGGGLPSLSIPRDRASPVGWHLHSASLSGWSPKKFSWPHRDNGEKV